MMIWWMKSGDSCNWNLTQNTSLLVFYEVGVVYRSKQLNWTTEETKVSRDRPSLSSGLITKAGREVKSLKNTERRNKAVVLAPGSISRMAIRNLNTMMHMLWKDGALMWSFSYHNDHKQRKTILKLFSPSPKWLISAL